MANVEAVINWFQARKGKVSYSMTNRLGPNSYDCSSAVFFSLIEGGFLPQGTGIGNTESLYQLEGSLLTEISRSQVQRGDIFVAGAKGGSGGANGHTGVFVNNASIIHCTGGRGIVETVAEGWMGGPPVYFYRLKGNTTNPPTGTARLDQQYGIDIFNITQAKAVEMVPKLQETFALTFLSDIVSIVQSNNAYEIKVVALTKPQAVKYVPVIQRLVAGTVPNYNLMDTFGVPQSNGSFWIRAINIRTANEANKLIPLIRRTVALDLMGPFVFGTTIDGKQGIRMKHLSKNEAEIIQQQIVKKWPELDMHTRIEFGK
ncbi:MAG: peptidoglycan amidohydrolase family protein [Carnobacterium sp.]|uniref:Bacteriophage peptidoglycan hydrolase family protein n=3 Tax=Carnobacterium maltaromaticum TaxID=2751 RepID=K8E5X2_CARML|nr:peptidoglycan amidohydrolase family protein [Carnobacterium maltaromaticum]KRN66342.1 muramidase [Carnobacterium maltaromaticum DSM 20342]KRN85923.1 muramidase [Carnobacterium maltaromaticum]MDT1943915.1 hypothetical protein [Carnobacterium maltaromaticum]MDT1999295.1 hypothetical protein [Carnobacterium maltaromaticum]MDW5524690.1 peptidoglycan amidohydrolase family protein [Carnobacterium maltaromaticum]